MARSRTNNTAPQINPALAGMPPWWSNLDTKADGGARSILLNGDIAFSQDPAFFGAIALDKFRGQVMAMKPLPWDPNALVPRPWTDADDHEATLWLQSVNVYLSTKLVNACITGVAARNAFHPVLEYYERLGGIDPQTSIWDKRPRLGDDNTISWLTYYCGVADSEFIRAVGARWMISAVARIFDPGCLAHCVLILEGRTGIGKSSVFRTLGSPWYTADIPALNSEAAQERLIGKHIIELDELDAVQRASDWTSVLSFVSKDVDFHRLKYAYRSKEFPRQCIFGGSTERDTWQREHIGHRRWWPAKCTAIDIPTLVQDKDQLWAETLLRYGQGEKWWLFEDALVEAAAEITGARVETDPWDQVTRDYVRWKKSITPHELLTEAVGMDLDRASPGDQLRIGKIMRRLGWIRVRKRIINGSGRTEIVYVYMPPDTPEDELQSDF